MPERTTRRQPHPAFTAAKPEHRYTGRLTILRNLLFAEARQRPYSHRAWRILRGGVVISLHARPGAPIVLRIARPERTTDPAAWDRELIVFAHHLGIREWHRQPDPDAPASAVTFTEPPALLTATEVRS
jgi:hypothetical protein